MRFDLARLIGPLVAAIVLVAVFQETMGALRAGGVWRQRRLASAQAVSPYARIESLLAGAASAPGQPTRDPFAFGHAPVPAPSDRPARPRPTAAPVAPARPVLTSIVWLSDSPSATVRWNGRDYPVQVNTLFDEFRVVSISRDQVTLARGGETFVLQLPKKGD
jgi:hypothetical protein